MLTFGKEEIILIYVYLYNLTPCPQDPVVIKVTIT